MKFRILVTVKRLSSEFMDGLWKRPSTVFFNKNIGSRK